ncbi:MAG: hypothetical protein NZ455_10215 [Bacteroidia bacterium]|nr:hypothetical protein [Bacteroidia bacterium]
MQNVLREACGGCISSAQHRSEAQPVARRPCGHTRSVTPTRTRQRVLNLTFTPNDRLGFSCKE